MLCVTRVVVLAGEEVSSRFAGAELGLEILREKHDKTADDWNLTADAQARHHVNWVGQQAPHCRRKICRQQPNQIWN